MTIFNLFDLWFDLSNHTVCILYTELVNSVLRVCIARIREGRSRNFSTFLFLVATEQQKFLDFSPFSRVTVRWKFLDLSSISPCDEETEISQPFPIFPCDGERQISRLSNF